jgi:YVTN family beta-propeller protein
MRPSTPRALTALLPLALAAAAGAQTPAGFVNWESPHVSPLAMTPDGTRLLAVNTADARLEVFTLGAGPGGAPKKTASIPVGLDPVTVRVRSNAEAWVVNHISDTVSVVDLSTLAVKATLKTQDEPWDVVFAGSPQKAFVSCGTAHVVQVFDPVNTAAAPTEVNILGEQPRALAVSPDGSSVYVAVFESGNNTTLLGGGAAGNNIGFPPNVVSLAQGPYGGTNPPPNSGNAFSPAIATANPPKVSLIVRKDPLGRWMDDNAHDWTAFVSGASAAQSGRPVGWDLYDNDVAILSASSPASAPVYVHGLMNICMAMGVNPATGRVLVVGTDAINQVRFEPNVRSRFVRVIGATFDKNAPAAPTVADLNPHLTYTVPTVPQATRDLSVGDPRAVVFNAAGTRGYVAGMGSSSVVQVDGAGARDAAAPPIFVPEGPTGLALDEARGRLYVLSKFAASVSAIDTATGAVVSTVPFFDPTPAAIKVGRKHLYDTRKNSGLGQAACASCHVDATTDHLAWDLGDPAGASIAVSTATRNLGFGLLGLEPGTTPTAFQPYHPMKGPMTTQTLQDIIGKEPHHWRGDKLGLEEFNGAFISLNGDDTNLTPTEMQQFEDFLATVTFPPNPYRNFDNSLPTSLPLPGRFTTGRFAPAGQPLPSGNAVNGLAAYRSQTTRLDMNAFACVTCHTLPTGAGPDMKQTGPFTPPYVALPTGPNGEHHLGLVSTDGLTNVTMKVPQLRNEYKKSGFNLTQTRNTAGFGLVHDGSVDSIERFVAEPVFNVTGDQMVADLTAFILCISGSDLPAGSPTSPLEPPGPPSKDTHAAVGAQTTFAATGDTARLNAMTALADAGKVGLIAKGAVGGVQRGYAYTGSATGWKPDRRAEANLTTAALTALASTSTPITFTVVPAGAQTRLGIDRDSDGWFDRDEASVCADPGDPARFPGSAGVLDANADLQVDLLDIFAFLSNWFIADPRADFNGTSGVELTDIFAFLTAWFSGCN